MGIIESDLNLILSKNKVNVADIKSDMSKMNEHMYNLKVYFDDFDFVKQRIHLDSWQQRNIKTKLDSYETVLINVIGGYKNQDEQIYYDIKRASQQFGFIRKER